MSFWQIIVDHIPLPHLKTPVEDPIRTALRRYMDDDYCQARIDDCFDPKSTKLVPFCGECAWCKAKQALGEDFRVCRCHRCHPHQSHSR